jgi:5'-deoxynucleotidase YfbR-like HD superfamily hydrolase
VPPQDALDGLLHDATEAYMVDVPRPLKAHLSGYKELEAKTWRVIADAFALPSELPASVHYADNAILLAEKEQLMYPNPPGLAWEGADKYRTPDVLIVGYTPTRAREVFLNRFHELTK